MTRWTPTESHHYEEPPQAQTGRSQQSISALCDSTLLLRHVTAGCMPGSLGHLRHVQCHLSLNWCHEWTINPAPPPHPKVLSLNVNVLQQIWVLEHVISSCWHGCREGELWTLWDIRLNWWTQATGGEPWELQPRPCFAVYWDGKKPHESSHHHQRSCFNSTTFPATLSWRPSNPWEK